MSSAREAQRREHNEQKELESLRRVFEILDKNKDNKVDFKELNDQLVRLDYRAKKVEVEDMIWEVDEDCDHCVSWEEFQLMFHRCRSDRVRWPPPLSHGGCARGAACRARPAGARTWCG
jgi:calmodulin